MGDDTFLRDGNVFIEERHVEAVAPILAAAGFYVAGFDKIGNIAAIDFDGQDIGDDESFAMSLVPYTRDGSYLEFCNDRGYIWRWVYYDGVCTRVSPVMLWPKPGTPCNLSQQIQHAFMKLLMADQ